MRRDRAFTLLELMIVVAMIAVLVAIAIPGLLAAQRTANERSASATMKVFGTAQADFRSNDRDGNRVQDYWTLDVFAFFGLFPATATGALPADSTVAAGSIRLIDMPVAGSDGSEQTASYGNVTVASTIVVFSPKAGYVLQQFDQQLTGGVATTMLNDTDGGLFYGAAHDRTRFAVMAFPESLSSGRLLFVMNQDLTIYKYILGSAYTSGYSGGTTSTSAVAGTGQPALFDDVSVFPESPGSAGCSKLD